MKKIIKIFLLVSLFILLSWSLKQSGLFLDETVHFEQTSKYLNGAFGASDPYLTTFPTYHLIIAVAASSLNLSSLFSLRLISLFLSLLTIIIFFLSAGKIDRQATEQKTWQFIFLPLLFPFLFLIYTDIFSLLLILLSLFLLLNERNYSAGLLGVLAVLTRQNNIVWLLFALAYIFYRQYKKKGVHYLKDFLREGLIFIFGLIAFVFFVIINQGVALGDQIMHPFFFFSFGNLFFLLFLFFFLFLPGNIYNFKKIVTLVRGRREIIFWSIGLFLFYLIFFRVDHPYNNYFFHWQEGIESFSLRNSLLFFINKNWWTKTLAFAPILYSVFSLAVSELEEKSFYLLYPFTFLYLLPSWLIEGRYYIIPLVLFILFKKPAPRPVEYATILIFVLLSAILFYGLREVKFFF